MKSRIRSSGLVSEQSRELAPLALRPEAAVSLPWVLIGQYSVVCLVNWHFCLKETKYTGGGGQRAGEGGAFYVKKNLLLSTGENPASP